MASPNAISHLFSAAHCFLRSAATKAFFLPIGPSPMVSFSFTSSTIHTTPNNKPIKLNQENKNYTKYRFNREKHLIYSINKKFQFI
jgi:hypothetical protein